MWINDDLIINAQPDHLIKYLLVKGTADDIFVCEHFESTHL